MGGVGVVIPAAGQGRRMGLKQNKIWQVLGNRPVLYYSLLPFLKNSRVTEVVVVLQKEEFEVFQEEIMPLLGEGFSVLVKLVEGGQERRDSVLRGLKALSKESDLVAVHDGARPFLSENLLNRLIEVAEKRGSAIPALPLKDTIKKVEGSIIKETLLRDSLFAVQTPQVFYKERLLAAYEEYQGITVTDDASLMELAGYSVYTVPGEEYNIKLTTKEDLLLAEFIIDREKFMRTGIGFDVHKKAEGRRLVLGGVEIEAEKGLLGHSDADVLTHAVMDSILGAAGLGDIGEHFPDTDNRYRDVNSLSLLKQVKDLIEKRFVIGNIDVILMAERPKISGFKDLMRSNIAEVLNISVDRVNIKATTTERLGFVGRDEGIACQAIATLYERGE